MIDEFGFQNRFRATIDDGKMELLQRDAFNEYVENARGGDYHITVDKIATRRTLQQNKYYWGVVVKFMSFITGYTARECHDILVGELLPPKIDFVSGVVVETKPSTTDLNTHEFFEFVESARLFVMYEFGVNIPLPDS